MRIGGRGSSDIDDLRGQGGGGGRFRIPGRMGLGALLVLLVLSVVFKQNFFSLVGIGEGAGTTAAGPVASTPEEDKLKDFIGGVLDDVQGTWDQQLPAQAGTPYQHARL